MLPPQQTSSLADVITSTLELRTSRVYVITSTLELRTSRADVITSTLVLSTSSVYKITSALELSTSSADVITLGRDVITSACEVITLWLDGITSVEKVMYSGQLMVGSWRYLITSGLQLIISSFIVIRSCLINTLKAAIRLWVNKLKRRLAKIDLEKRYKDVIC